MDKLINTKQPTDSSVNLKYPRKVCPVAMSLLGARQAGKIWENFIHNKSIRFNLQQYTPYQRLYF